MNCPALPAFVLGALVGTSACSVLTEPVTTTESAPPKPSAAAQNQPAQNQPSPSPEPGQGQGGSPAAPPEMAAASHILIAYQGAMRAAPTTTRTKDEAKKRAEEVLARAKKGEDFAKLADEVSDDPTAKINHGSLGRFPRDRMIKQFSDATFSIKPGELSGVIETPFGFHIIKRTE